MPSAVSRTRTPRRSPGSGWRSTKPRAASRSTRLVIVPLVTRVSATRWPGLSSCGAPVRRSADSTSNSQLSRPVPAKARPAGEVEPAGEPRDAGEHLERGDVEVGTLPSPRGDDTVDVVSGHGPRCYSSSSFLTSRHMARERGRPTIRRGGRMRTSPSWDPAAYGRFARERSRPLADLVAQVQVDEPGLVVDLGCGHGPATLSLARAVARGAGRRRRLGRVDARGGPRSSTPRGGSSGSTPTCATGTRPRSGRPPTSSSRTPRSSGSRGTSTSSTRGWTRSPTADGSRSRSPATSTPRATG